MTWTVAILPFMEQQTLQDQYNFNVFNEDPANAFVRESIVDTHLCPSDINTDNTERPESGPGSGLQYAPGSYRAVSGATTGACWQDANQSNSFCDTHLGVLHHTGGTHLASSGGRTLWMAEDFSSIVDGTSNTLLLGEMSTRTRNRRRTFWAYTYTSYNQSSITVGQPRTLIGNYNECVSIGGRGGSNPCKRGWGSNHPQVIQFCMADGSVRPISEYVDMGVGNNNTSVLQIGVLPALATTQGQELVQLP